MDAGSNTYRVISGFIIMDKSVIIVNN